MNDSFNPKYITVRDMYNQKRPGLIGTFGLGRIILAVVTVFVLLICFGLGLYLFYQKHKTSDEPMEEQEGRLEDPVAYQDYYAYINDFLDTSYGFQFEASVSGESLVSYVPEIVAPLFEPYSTYIISGSVLPESVVVSFSGVDDMATEQFLTTLLLTDDGTFWNVENICTIDARTKDIEEVKDLFSSISDGVQYVQIESGMSADGTDIYALLKQIMTVTASAGYEISNDDTSYSIRTNTVDWSSLPDGYILSSVLKNQKPSSYLGLVSNEGSIPFRDGTLVVQINTCTVQGTYSEISEVSPKPVPYYVTEAQLNDLLVATRQEYDRVLAEAMQAIEATEEAGQETIPEETP